MWSMKTISKRPRYALSQWQCFEIDSNHSWGRNHRFAGALGRSRLFHVTDGIVEFDSDHRTAATSIVNFYMLEDAPGLTPEVLKQRQRTCEKYRFTGIADVTAELVHLMAKASGRQK